MLAGPRGSEINRLRTGIVNIASSSSEVADERSIPSLVVKSGVKPTFGVVVRSASYSVHCDAACLAEHEELTD